MRKLLYILAFGVVALLWSCDGKEKKQMKSYAEAEEEFLATVTEADSTGVLALTNEFMENVKSGDLENAVSMLYEYDVPTAAISPMGPELAQSVIGFFNQFPVQSYKLNYFAFSVASFNDVKYDIIFGEDADGNPMKTSFTLNPVRKDGQWYICVKQREMPSKTMSHPIDPRTPVGYK